MLAVRRRGFVATATPDAGSVSVGGNAATVVDISESGGDEDTLEAVYDLTLIWPREAGTTPETGVPVFPSGHRIFSAHPSMAYEIIARPRGGVRPYTWSLSNEPSGMTIDEDTGEITWASPSGTVTPTVHLTDATGATTSQSWTITTDATRFRFFDAVNGSNSNDGSISAPWQTLAMMTAATVGRICVFRSGTYSVAGLYTNGVTSRVVTTANFTPTTTSFELEGTTSVVNSSVIFANGTAADQHVLVTAGSVQGSSFRVTGVHSPLNTPPSNGASCGVGNTWQRKEYSAGGSSVQWIAYPGETWSIDGNFQSITTDWGAMLRVSGNTTYPVWVSGCYDSVNFLDKAFQFGGGAYSCFWDHRYTSTTLQAVYDGSNSAYIMQVGGSTTYFFMASDIDSTDSDVGIMKCYDQTDPLYQRLISRYGWDLKDSQTDYEVMECVWRNTLDRLGLFGNMSGTTRGHIAFCLLDLRDSVTGNNDGVIALEIGQDGTTGPTYVDRCTILRRARVRNVGTGDGPIRFRRCVTLNDDASYTDRIYLDPTTTPSLVEYFENLSGGLSDGIVDDDGNLQGEYRTTYLGSRGWEFA